MGDTEGVLVPLDGLFRNRDEHRAHRVVFGELVVVIHRTQERRVLEVREAAKSPKEPKEVGRMLAGKEVGRMLAGLFRGDSGFDVRPELQREGVRVPATHVI